MDSGLDRALSPPYAATSRNGIEQTRRNSNFTVILFIEYDNLSYAAAAGPNSFASEPPSHFGRSPIFYFLKPPRYSISRGAFLTSNTSLPTLTCLHVPLNPGRLHFTSRLLCPEHLVSRRQTHGAVLSGPRPTLQVATLALCSRHKDIHPLTQVWGTSSSSREMVSATAPAMASVMAPVMALVMAAHPRAAHPRAADRQYTAWQAFSRGRGRSKKNRTRRPMWPSGYPP